MSSQLDVFNLGVSTPPALGLHGDAIARASVHTAADFHRGIDLSAGFDLAAEVDASVRDGVTASIGGGVGASAGVAFQANFPLDLFHQAGVIARLQAQIEASAFVSAKLG